MEVIMFSFCFREVLIQLFILEGELCGAVALTALYRGLFLLFSLPSLI